jgi:small conductance mechanosensitive channel
MDSAHELQPTDRYMHGFNLLLAIDWKIDFQETLDEVKSFVAQRGLDFLVNLVAAIAVYIVGKWATRLIVRLLNSIMKRSKVDETLAKFLSDIAQTLLFVLVILMALNRLGVDTTSLAAILGAAGIAIGIALQGSLSNFAAGVMLILFKPFRVGDFVEAGGTSGTVEQITIFNTLLRTGDNKQVIVPNGGVISGNIINFSAKPTRRIDLVIGCSYGDDLRAVKAFLEEVVRSDDRILPEPEPVVAVSALGASSVDFVVRPWVRTSDYWTVMWDLTEQIKLGFDERGFNFPFPSRDVYVHNEAA